MQQSVAVTLKVFATLRKKYGFREMEVRCDGTLRGLVEEAAKAVGNPELVYEVFDKDGKPRDDRIIMINGRNLKDLRGRVELKTGDVVAVFPPIAGG